ncbi:MAG: hypothetical protein QXE18_02445 [Thermoplasmata archaeon]
MRDLQKPKHNGFEYPKPIKNQEPNVLDYREIPKKMAFEYAHTYLDVENKILDEILGICESFSKRNIDLDKFLSDIASFIHRTFGIADVSIGLKDMDGLYRYRAFAGFRDSAIAFKKKLAYRKEDFFDNPPYKGNNISKYTRLYLVEESPFDEKEREAFNWPSLISMKRPSLTRALEADYFNIHLIGPDDDLIGWIDISGTKQRTFPDIKTIKWIELIGRIVTATILIHKPK